MLKYFRIKCWKNTAVSLIPQSQALQCHWHQWVWLRGIQNTAKSEHFSVMTSGSLQEVKISLHYPFNRWTNAAVFLYLSPSRLCLLYIYSSIYTLHIFLGFSFENEIFSLRNLRRNKIRNFVKMKEFSTGKVYYIPACCAYWM